MNNLLTRDEIIALIREMDRLTRSNIDGEELEGKLRELHYRLESGVLDPEILNYIYWDLSEPTPEDIADRALAYEPIILPDESQR